jgi:hypothetical protein
MRTCAVDQINDKHIRNAQTIYAIYLLRLFTVGVND